MSGIYTYIMGIGFFVWEYPARLVEFVSEDEGILHYGSCDLFVAPSVYEEV